MITIESIAEQFKGTIVGDANKEITHIDSIKDAKKGSLSYVSDTKYYYLVKNTKASVVIVPFDDAIPESNATLIRVKSPAYVFTMILKQWEQVNKKERQGISENAVISKTAKIGENVYIQDNVVIDEKVKIGNNTKIMANTFIGQNTVIGQNCIIYPNVAIRDNVCIGNNVIIHSGVVIGSDGFGFLFDKDIHVKIPQIGMVQIHDNVEIGANTTIDRATIGKTVIGEGTKIDNLVQIAHNVEIGKHCIICAQVGIAGSTTIGNYVTIAGQAGVTGHISVGDGSTIAGQAGVTKPVKPKDIVSGFPATNHKEANHLHVLQRKLPEIYETVKYLKKEIKNLRR